MTGASANDDVDPPKYGDARATPNPYGVLIAEEVKRGEDDLIAVRARAISILSTVAGVVALITGAITFAASKDEAANGIPDAAIGFLGGGLLAFVLAASIAIRINAPCDVQKPLVGDLYLKVSLEGWSDGEDNFERERVVAEAMVGYLESLRGVVDEFGRKLGYAVDLLTIGLVLLAVSAVWTAVTI